MLENIQKNRGGSKRQMHVLSVMKLVSYIFHDGGLYLHLTNNEGRSCCLEHKNLLLQHLNHLSLVDQIES